MHLKAQRDPITQVNTKQVWPLENFPALRFLIGWPSVKCQTALERFGESMKTKS